MRIARWRAGRCCRPATSASRTDSRATTTAAGSSAGGAIQASGSGSSHETSSGGTGPGGRSVPSSGPVRPDGSSRIGRAARRQADVGGDRVEPGPERRPGLEPGVGPPRPQVGLLHQVLGVVRRADHAVAVRQQFPAELLGLGAELSSLNRSSGDSLRSGEATSREYGGLRAAGPVLPTVARRLQVRQHLRAVGQVVRRGPPGRDARRRRRARRAPHDLSEELRRGLDQHAEVEADEVDLVPVHQLPVGDGGVAARHAVDDDTAGDPLGRGQARVERGAAGRLQHHIDAGAAGQAQHLGGEVAAARVEDVVGAQCPHDVVLARRGGGDDRRAEVLGERDRGLAGRAGRGMDQHGLPGGDAAQGLEGGERGRPVDDEAQCLLLASSPAGTGIAAAAGSTMYSAKAPSPTPTTWAPASGPVTASPRGDDLAGGLETGQVRRPRAVRERAAGPARRRRS